MVVVESDFFSPTASSRCSSIDVGASGGWPWRNVDSARVGAGGDRLMTRDVRDREAFDHHSETLASRSVVFAILLWRHVNPGVLVLVAAPCTCVALDLSAINSLTCDTKEIDARVVRDADSLKRKNAAGADAPAGVLQSGSLRLHVSDFDIFTSLPW